MIKPFLYVIFLGVISSCGYRTLEGRVKPVYFSAADAVFADTLLPTQEVYYQNVLRLGYPCLEIVDLRKGETAVAFISKPTFFRKEQTDFLIYPKEHISITADSTKEYSPTFSTLSRNKVRDNELLVLKLFQELENRPKIPNLINTYQEVEDAENALKNDIAPLEHASQLLFDSLCKVYQVSRKFKKLTKDYVRNRYDVAVLGLYEVYRNTLQAHKAYHRKVRGMLPLVNGITKTSQFNFNVESTTNCLYTCLFSQSGIRNMATQEGGFQACFDSIAVNFTGPARDYLLSRLFFRTLEQGFTIPAGYKKKYRNFSLNKEYRKVIRRAGRLFKRHAKDTTAVANDLLMADGKTKVRLEEILLQHKGKYVLVDLWASWCVPCIKEMPALQALAKSYPADQIAFLSISVDASIPAWRRRFSQLRMDDMNSYLLLNKDKAGLVRDLSLSTIPRYILYDKDGKMINADAPFPSEPALGELLNNLLLK